MQQYTIHNRRPRLAVVFPSYPHSRELEWIRLALLASRATRHRTMWLTRVFPYKERERDFPHVPFTSANVEVLRRVLRFWYVVERENTPESASSVARWARSETDSRTWTRTSARPRPSPTKMLMQVRKASARLRPIEISSNWAVTVWRLSSVWLL